MKYANFRKKITIFIVFLFIGASFILVSSGKTVKRSIENHMSLNITNKIFKQNFQSMFTKKTFMVEMRDGIKLATDVYLPDGGSPPHGALLYRTPYNKNKSGMGGWADNGWPSIVQDCRGRFQSEGIDTMFRDAHTDGPDTLEWIASQNWSNGKVATFGGSAMGIVQYLMAGANPSQLSCQHIGPANPNLYTTIYPGGQFRKYMIEGWLELQGSSYILPELWAAENYSLEYWTNVSLEDNWQDVNVPAVHIGGWYDCFSQGTLDGFMGYQYDGGSGAAGKSKLIMGPWTHAQFGEREQGELTYPENAKETFFNDYLNEILDQYILEINNDFENRPNVFYYVMGDAKNANSLGNFWRCGDDWPPACIEDEWYFHENNVLSLNMPGTYSPVTYTYNPTNPAPTKGGTNLWPFAPTWAGPYDQKAIENRNDVLVFTSEPLTEFYEATGPIKARLYVSSDCPDTDFTVKLTDVYPSGESMLICDGILRMRNRNGFDHWEFMSPGTVYEVEVDLWSTSYIWEEGHKIRVSVSSSNYPRYLANPNTKDGINQNTDYNIAQNTLYMDSARPSCIILPRYNENYAPFKPMINGPKKGLPGTEYEFTFNSTDYNNDDIYYFIDWGDGSDTGWIGPFSSGVEINQSHTWSQTKIYNIKAKAKDIHDDEGRWATSTINIPRNKAINTFLSSLLERFPLLKQLFSIYFI